MISLLKNLFTREEESLASDVSAYIQNTYPSNHSYSIRHKKLIPARKLAKRFKIIKEYYPTPLTSFLDLSCCKGFFIFDAALRDSCERVLGVDVCADDLSACQQIKSFLNTSHVEVKALYLHELVAQINQLGGAYQTVLLINAYQYLFFGSDRDPHGYFCHDEIFKLISQVCHTRVIFNNRTELLDCQNKKQINDAYFKKITYSTKAIHEAASRYFKVSDCGTYGGYPLWILDK